MGYRLSATNRSLLLFLAEHRVVLVTQVAALLGVTQGAANQRLRRLADHGFVERRRIFAGLPSAARITRKGLRMIDSPLPPPSLDLQVYRHDVGVAWLWLAARSGAFGEHAEAISEREMRSADGRAGRASAPVPYGVGTGATGPNGLPQRHYPDLLLRLGSSRTLAVELELTRKSARRLTGIMRGYAGDARIDGVLYLVADRHIGAAVQAAARRAGLSQMVHVQLLADGDSIEGAPTAGARVGRGTRGQKQARGVAAPSPGATGAPHRAPADAAER